MICARSCWIWVGDRNDDRIAFDPSAPVEAPLAGVGLGPYGCLVFVDLFHQQKNF